MTAEEQLQQALLQYPALEEVLDGSDGDVRAAVLHAITLAIREAQHTERLECARIAVEYIQACSDSATQALADGIATQILERDTET